MASDAPTGPVLTSVAERQPTHVYVLSTPRMAERSEATAEAIRARHPKTEVEILDVPLKDPTNYVGILRQIRRHFASVQRRHPGDDFLIQISSGTPQMHACWLLLVAAGEIPATVIQTIPPEFVPEAGSCVREVDLAKDEFPLVTRRMPQGSTVGEAPDLAAIRAELGIVGDDPAFLAALREAATYASYDEIHLLLLGETGTGKEVVTSLIHRLSDRSERPMVTVNCSSIPSELLESQLFGHKRGAFTGATHDQEGKFRSADGGILFLDELGELPMKAQAKLLRALDQGEIEPVGSPKAIRVNVRVVAATNRDLRRMIAEGAFREDLYQRFGASLSLPSLRQRRTDIPLLATYILNEWNRRHQKQRSLSAKALAALVGQHWHGNIRELRRVIQQSAMLSDCATLTESDLRFELPLAANPIVSVPEPDTGFKINGYLDQMKDKIVRRALEKTGGVQAKAARLLGWTPQALSQYLKS